MKMHLLVIGKTNQDFVQLGIDEYSSRIKHYFPFEVEVIPDLKNTKNMSVEQQKSKEGEFILKAIQPGDCPVLLDDKGQEFTSLNFAAFLEKKALMSVRRLVFIIGGPYGFSSEVYAACRERLSLSKMTFSHQVIRLIFMEQLYRAMTILHNEPYHHE